MRRIGPPDLDVLLYDDALQDAGHYLNTVEDDARIARATVGILLSWYQEITRSSWQPLVLFWGDPARVIGLGWRGLLLIWRSL